MADCTLALIIDQEGPHVAGQKLSGRLEVRAHGEVRFDHSRVTLKYRTSGRGSVDEGGELPSMGEGMIASAGETLEIPFDFVVPSEPVTLHGELITLQWFVHAELAIPWAFDPNVEEEIVVVPAPREATAGGGYRDPPRRLAEEGGAAPATAPNTGATAVVFGVFALFSVFMILRWKSAGNGTFHVIQIVVVLFFLSITLWRFAGRDILNRLAAKGIGTPQVDIGPGRIPRGESIDVAVTLAPPGTVTLERVQAVLRCVEKASSGSGKNRSTKTFTAHTEDVTLVEDIEVKAGSSRTFQGKLRIPDAAHPTLALRDNKVEWEVSVVVSPRGGLDHLTEATVEVVA